MAVLVFSRPGGSLTVLRPAGSGLGGFFEHPQNGALRNPFSDSSYYFNQLFHPRPALERFLAIGEKNPSYLRFLGQHGGLYGKCIPARPCR